MKTDKTQKWVDVKDLNPIQQHYIENVIFLSMYGKNIEGTIKDWDKKFKTLKQQKHE